MNANEQAAERLATMRARANRTPARDWAAGRRAAQLPVGDRTDAEWALADLHRESC